MAGTLQLAVAAMRTRSDVCVRGSCASTFPESSSYRTVLPMSASELS
jgi:hypothetical protein